MPIFNLPGTDYFLLNTLLYSKLHIEVARTEITEKRPRKGIGRVVGSSCYITGHS